MDFYLNSINPFQSWYTQERATDCVSARSPASRSPLSYLGIVSLYERATDCVSARSPASRSPLSYLMIVSLYERATD